MPTEAPEPALPSQQAEADLPREFVREDPWRALRRWTPARVGLGRVGVSMPTRELLDFSEAHARARDAVHLPLDVADLLQRLRGPAPEAEPVHVVQSAAPDRLTYLLRPDLGRRLSVSSAALLEATDDRGADLLLVLADGLSSANVAHQGPGLVAALRAGRPDGWRLGPLVVATQARVALGDEIASRLGAGMVAMLIGERPGLSSPDSLGIYLTSTPHVGCSDAERNCISNVRAEGLSVEEAARKLWWLATQARKQGGTGVGLKDESQVAPAQAISATSSERAPHMPA